MLNLCSFLGTQVDQKELDDMEFQIEDDADGADEKKDEDEPNIDDHLKGKLFIELELKGLRDEYFKKGKSVFIVGQKKNVNSGDFHYSGHSELVREVPLDEEGEFKPYTLCKTFLVPRPLKSDQLVYRFTLYNMVNDNFSDADPEHIIGSADVNLSEVYHSDNKMKEEKFIDRDEPLEVSLNVTTRKPKTQGPPSRYSMTISCSDLPVMEDFGGSNPIIVLSVNDANQSGYCEVGQSEPQFETTDPTFSTPIIVDSYASMERDLKFTVHDAKTYETSKMNSVVAIAKLPFSQFMKIRADAISGGDEGVVLLTLQDSNGESLDGMMSIVAEEIEIPDESGAEDDKKPKVGLFISIKGIMKEWMVDDGKLPTTVLYKKNRETNEFDYIGQTERISHEPNPVYTTYFCVDMPGSELDDEERSQIMSGDLEEKEYHYRLDIHDVESDDQKALSLSNKIATTVFNLNAVFRASEPSMFQMKRADDDDINDNFAILEAVNLGIITNFEFWAVLSGLSDDLVDAFSAVNHMCVALFARDKHSGVQEFIAAVTTPGFTLTEGKFHFYEPLKVPSYSARDRQMQVVFYKLEFIDSEPWKDKETEENSVYARTFFSLNEFLSSPEEALEWPLEIDGKLNDTIVVELYKTQRIDPNAAAAEAAAEAARLAALGPPKALIEFNSVTVNPEKLQEFINANFVEAKADGEKKEGEQTEEDSKEGEKKEGDEAKEGDAPAEGEKKEGEEGEEKKAEDEPTKEADATKEGDAGDLKEQKAQQEIDIAGYLTCWKGEEMLLRSAQVNLREKMVTDAKDLSDIAVNCIIDAEAAVDLSVKVHAFPASGPVPEPTEAKYLLQDFNLTQNGDYKTTNMNLTENEHVVIVRFHALGTVSKRKLVTAATVSPATPDQKLTISMSLVLKPEVSTMTEEGVVKADGDTIVFATPLEVDWYTLEQVQQAVVVNAMLGDVKLSQEFKSFGGVFNGQPVELKEGDVTVTLAFVDYKEPEPEPEPEPEAEAGDASAPAERSLPTADGAAEPAADPESAPAKAEEPAADGDAKEPAADGDAKAEEPAAGDAKGEEPAADAAKAEEPTPADAKAEETAAAAPAAEEPAATPAAVSAAATPAAVSETKAEEPAAAEAKAEDPAPEAKAEEPAPAEAKAEEPAPAEAKAEEPAPAEAKAEDPAPAEAKAEEPAADAAKAEEPAAAD
jgi:hypothetical protein